MSLGTNTLCLSTPGRVVAGVDPPSVAQANDFTDWLAELPPAAWLEVGRSIVGDRPQGAARDTAWTALQAAVADEDLRIAAWCVRDAVDTSAFLASRAARRWSNVERRLFAAAHRAAESAALALLAGSLLPVDYFMILYGPFTNRVGGTRASPNMPAQRRVATGRTG